MVLLVHFICLVLTCMEFSLLTKSRPSLFSHLCLSSMAEWQATVFYCLSLSFPRYWTEQKSNVSSAFICDELTAIVWIKATPATHLKLDQSCVLIEQEKTTFSYPNNIFSGVEKRGSEALYASRQSRILTLPRFAIKVTRRLEDYWFLTNLKSFS